MDLSAVEQAILDRFAEKSRMAGGTRTGFMLRKQSFDGLDSVAAGLDFDSGLASLTEKGLLLTSESGALYYLSEAGSEMLTASGVR